MSDTAYDKIADWYDEVSRSKSLAGEVTIGPVLELIGEIKDLQICDLACGQGRLSRELARRGGRVTGIDISTKLLGIARQDELREPLGITYLADDAQHLKVIADETFDKIVCQLALMDISDLTGTFDSVWRVLRPGGWFVFSITHPCFEAPHARWQPNTEGKTVREIHGYFEEGFWRSNNPKGVRGQVGAYHRTLSTYVNKIISAGFVVEEIIEPVAVEKETSSAGINHYSIPTFLIFRCLKN